MSCRRSLAVLAAVVVLLPLGALADRTVVLATGTLCPIDTLDSLDVRKAYLGVAVSIDGYHLRPLRLVGDEYLDSVFFQSIVAMSRKSYSRRALSLAIRFGTPRPVEFEDLQEALEYVRNNECSIFYAWADALEGAPNIKILKTLWQGK